ncbi:MAG: 3-oxoacyl-[acyl-carrier protein] reductase [Acidimicrobiales bacterium]|jgi:3-oxoacyl-[acyl-carrier protein] reductase
MDLDLAGKTALVTGSYRGTGRGIARVLAAEGAHVLIHGFEAGQAKATADELLAEGLSAEPVTADIRTDAGANQLATVADQVQVLVNNYGAPGGSSWSSLDTWTDEWNVNVLAAVRVTQLCIPAMRERGWGRIIFMGTVGTQQPGRRNAGYYGAKTALPTLVRTLAMELRGTGVTANLVSPGMIATDEVRSMVTRGAERDGSGASWPEAERWALDNSMPNLTERIPEPEDIGKVVAFVASEAAWHITGADMAVDGGARDA